MVFESQHPLVKHKLTLMRDKKHEAEEVPPTDPRDIDVAML